MGKTARVFMKKTDVREALGKKQHGHLANVEKKRNAFIH